MTPEEKDSIALLYASAYEHWVTMAAIEDKEHRLIREMKPSRVQMEMFQAYEWLLREGQPVRIIAAPKSRQSGLSTVTGHICYHHTRRFKCDGMMMADEQSRTDKIWEMFRRYAEHDKFAGFWDSRFDGNTEKCRFHYTTEEENGRKAKRVATWEHETANDAKAGAAGTRQVLWFSESMRYPKEGVAADRLVIGNAISSLPYSPGTVVILESTSDGPIGYVYDLYQGAVTLKDRIAGKIGNGWVKIFGGWHECDDYRLPVGRADTIPWFDDADPRFQKFKAREAAGRKLYEWKQDQIAWRRWKIISEYAGDEGLYDRDFPACAEDSFRASSSARFDPEGLAEMLSLATATHDKADLGTLIENEGVVRFQLDPEPWIWMSEAPMQGCAYCVFGDFMEGEQATGPESSLDCHAVGILREAYRDRNGLEWPDEVVAVIDIPNGCRWDTDVVADRMRMLSMLYGRCIVVPEANNCGGVVIEKLRMAGVKLYQRRHPDHRDPNKTQKALGFKTTTATKPKWIEAMATAIRKEPEQPMKLVCRYQPAVEEMQTFVRNPDGTCSAMANHHDDWVAAIAIALYCRSFTVYPRPEHRRYEASAPVLVSEKGDGAFG